MSTFHVKSPSAFISSSHPIEPTTTYNSYQTSVIETPIDLVMTAPTENDIADGGSNNLCMFHIICYLLQIGSIQFHMIQIKEPKYSHLNFTIKFG